MNIEKIKNWKQRGEVATLFTVATLVLMAAGTFLGAQQIVQNNILKLGSFAYNNTYRAHFYTGPTFQDKDTIPGQPNSGYTLIRGSLCFTGATIPSQLQRFWVHTPKDPNQGYPKKACDNTNADPKDDCIVYEGKTVEYIAPQTSRPYCDSPDVGKANWRAWDFTLKLQAPYTTALCSGLFVSSSSSFMFKDPIEMDMNSWHNFLKGKGVDCGPTPTVPPTASNTPVPTEFPTIKVPTARPTVDTRVSPGPFVTISIRPTDKPRCPDPKKPCPSVTPVGDCRGDIQCSKANPCPIGYACLHAKNDPLQIGVCQSLNPKCNPSATPTRSISQAPTNSPAQAKIRGEIVVNSCKKPDSVSTIICEKNNPARCIDTAGPVTFIGQDPANPNKWIYSYEHLQAPGANGGMEPVVTNAFYENMQAVAQYTSAGLIREPGRVSFPAAQLGNIRANATIPTGQTEAVINYEVPQNNIVCPPVTPSSVPPTVNPSPMACKYSAVVEVIDEATKQPIPLSQMGDLNKWGLANDKQPAKPTTLFKNYGEIISGERASRYTFKTDSLTFRNGTPADPNALYNKGDKAHVNLFIDTNKWQIISKTPCNGRGCPIPNEPVASRNLDQYGSTTDGFVMDCNTNIAKYGWTVRKLPDGNPGQCVMRDTANADKCTPKNVRAKLKSTSRVEVTWDPVSSSCPFNTSNGDFYRIDLVDMTQNPNAVVKTCDRISKTKAECRVDKSYDNNRGDFIRGHNYVANVYAIKEIPGSTDLCPGFNGIGTFNRPTRDNGGDENKPEPTGEPVGGTVLTRQLDWMVNNTGVCWAAWSRGDCRLAYNGSKKWVVSSTDKRFMCLSEEGSRKVTIGLVKGQEAVDISSKKVDCAGTPENACVAAKGTNISQCESNQPNATTYSGDSFQLKPNECWELDVDLRVNKVACPNINATESSKQPAPGKPGETQPPIDGGRNKGAPRTGTTGKGTVSIEASNEQVLLSVAGSEKINYSHVINPDEPKELQERPMKTISPATNAGTDNAFTYEIPDFEASAQDYYVEAQLDYVVKGAENIIYRSLSANRLIKKEDYTKEGIWDLVMKLDPTTDGLASETTFPIIKKGTIKIDSRKIGAKLEEALYLETDITVYVSSPGVSQAPVKADINLSYPESKFDYSASGLAEARDPGYAVRVELNYSYFDSNNKRIYRMAIHEFNMSAEKSKDPASWNSTIILRPSDRLIKTSSNTLNTISLRNNSSSTIKSVSIAACDSSNKCSSNTVPLQLAAGASTKFKPTFSVPNTTRRLSCVINYTNGTSKQCPPQLITSDGGLQFTITTQSNNSVLTSVLDPLKTADTNRDCKVTSADATGLRDLDGNGTVNASDTSLLFSFLGQNACK